MTNLYHGQFCRNPLHPGPCKGWKKNQGGSPAPTKKAATPTKKVAPKKSPAQLVKPNSKIGKPSKTDPADLPISKEVMEQDWKAHNDSLSPKEKKSVRLYSTGAHHYINRHMRTPPGQEPAPAPDTGILAGLDFDVEAQNLQNAMAPAPRGTKVFRGMGFNSAGLGPTPTEEEIEGLVGKVMRNDGFTSTSVSRRQAFEGFERGIEMELEVPKGTPSIWLNGNSDLPWEAELLLASGAKIQVTEMEYGESTVGGGNVWKMKARVVP